MTAALPMGTNKITGMADPTVATDAATKNYVDTTTATFFSTGDVKLTFKIAPDTGWLLFDDGTFGSAASGSSNSNNIANLALFTLFFNAPFTDTNLPILTSGGGATTRAAQVSASAAWAANCRMSLPKTLGRALAISGSGSGLTARTLGQSIGLETATLGIGNVPPIASTGTLNVVGSQTFPAIAGGNPVSSVQVANAGAGSFWVPFTNTGGIWGGQNAVTGTLNSTGTTDTPFSIMPPEVFLNIMVKV